MSYENLTNTLHNIIRNIDQNIRNSHDMQLKLAKSNLLKYVNSVFTIVNGYSVNMKLFPSWIMTLEFNKVLKRIAKKLVRGYFVPD